MWYFYIIFCYAVGFEAKYVSSTNNFEQEEQMHESACKTEHNKLYKYIRANGGWSNFSMRLVSKRDCDDATAIEIEQYIIKSFKATLQRETTVQSKETIREKRQQYYATHRELIKEKNTQHSINNREACRAKSKRYRELNAEKLKVKHPCVCGKFYRYDNKFNHFNTSYHINFTTSNQ